MNVFVLCTGRCGSKTFAAACAHMTNYSCAHESRAGMIGPERLNYPADHIEIDNRLAWYLGRLDQAYGDDAFYVHLRRDRDETARSYSIRQRGLMHAFRRGILQPPTRQDSLAVAYEIYDTVTSNIELFLSGKPRTMQVDLENAPEAFAAFWDNIGAHGDRTRAIETWGRAHNTSAEFQQGSPADRPSAAKMVWQKLARLARGLPGFIREV